MQTMNPDMVSPRVAKDESYDTLLIKEATGHKNMLHLIHLRWMAVLGQVLTIALCSLVLQVELPVFPMWIVLIVLVAFNAASHLRWYEERVATDATLFFSMMVDAVSLTLQLYFSGGTNNPFVFLFLLQIILSAVLLQPRHAWRFVLLSTVLVAALSEFHVPLKLDYGSPFNLSELYRAGLVICFALISGLMVFFITRIAANLRAGESYLASLRQRNAEQEHIVRMGLLASGAAHELGTPMATMSVILGDWRQDPQIMGNSEIRDDVRELESQLLRCKSIVSGILMSAGETRGEGSRIISLSEFVKTTLKKWQEGRPTARLSCIEQLDGDHRVAFDSTVQQMLFNLLDNAADASSKPITVEVSCQAGELLFRVTDRGRGFKPDILAQFGKPYNSSKGRPGGGLGLFLVVNVARMLGGTANARNLSQGGAEVTVSLPLKSVVVNEGPVDA